MEPVALALVPGSMVCNDCGRNVLYSYLLASILHWRTALCIGIHFLFATGSDWRGFTCCNKKGPITPETLNHDMSQKRNCD